MSSSKTKKITAEDLDDKNMKVRVNCWIDGDIILELREQAKKQGTKYQTLLNKTLREALFSESSIEKRLKRIEKALLKKA